MKVSGLSKEKMSSALRILMAEHSEIAAGILTRINEPVPPPRESDLTKIGSYYEKFMEVMDIRRSPWRTRKNRKEMYYDRLFIAVMIHLYCPQIHQVERSSLIIMNGFCPAIAQVIGNYYTNVSKFIRQVIHWEVVYDDFRQEVQRLLFLIYPNIPHGKDEV